MIFSDFAKALGQLSDPRFRRVLGLGLGLTLALLFGIYAVVLLVVTTLAPETVALPIIGEVTWVKNLISGASVLLMILLSVFLMVPVASIFTSLFLDEVAQAVEDKHYPHLPIPARISFNQVMLDSLNFMGLLIGANLLALFAYAMFPPFAPLIFYALNGFLLGREYFQLVAIRRMDRNQARRMAKDNLPQIWIAGCLMALPLTIPIVNLLIPILGAATFTHLFHRLSR